MDAHLATYDAAGAVSGIDDRSILAILVGAIKQIASITGVFKDTLVAWLGSATNGLTRLHTQELCVGATCVTPEQFQAVFGNRNAAAGASDVADAQAPSGSSTSGEADVDTATTTTPISDEEGIAEGEPEPEVPEPTSTELEETSPDVAPDVSPPENATEPLPEAANDNGIGIEALPANEPIEKSPAVNE